MGSGIAINMGSGIAIIMIPAPVKLLRGPRRPRIFLLGLIQVQI